MNQTTNGTTATDIINPDWILLDTCYTISSVRNRNLVQDFCACDTDKGLRAYNNGLHQDYNYTATMTMLKLKVFYNGNYLTKTILFAAVERKFSITIDTGLDPAINMHLSDSTIIMLKKCNGGLYYYGTNTMEHNNINSQVPDYILLNTVDGKKAYLHQGKIK